MDAAVEVEDLVKSYGATRAVDGLSFRVPVGTVFGLLGPNGAGKTSALEIVEGLRVADSGRVSVLGLPMPTRRADVVGRLSAQLQLTALANNLTCYEVLDLFGSFYARRRDPDALLEEFGLREKRNALAKRLSGGQKQRLSLALALINDPELIFLDEPSAGLDAQARRDLWDKVGAWKAAGRTIVLTTHYLEEAQALCDEVAIVDHGRIIAQGRPDELVRRHAKGDAIAVRLEGPVEIEELAGLPGVSAAYPEDGMIVLFSAAPPHTLVELTSLLARRGAHLRGVEIRPASLEDVFLELTGRRIRD